MECAPHSTSSEHDGSIMSAYFSCTKNYNIQPSCLRLAIKLNEQLLKVKRYAGSAFRPALIEAFAHLAVHTQQIECIFLFI